MVLLELDDLDVEALNIAIGCALWNERRAREMAADLPELFSRVTNEPADALETRLRNIRSRMLRDHVAGYSPVEKASASKDSTAPTPKLLGGSALPCNL